MIPHKVIQLITISFWVPGTRLHLPLKSTNKTNPSEANEEPSDTVIHFYFYFFLIHRRAVCSQPVRGNVHRIRRMFPEHVERIQLRRSWMNTLNYIREAKVRPIKNQLYSQKTPSYVREQMFAQLRTGLTEAAGRTGSPSVVSRR